MHYKQKMSDANPSLILSPRQTDDIHTLQTTALNLGWTVHRLTSWRIDSSVKLPEQLAIYGEPLFARLVAAQLNRVLLEPPHDWLTHLTPHFTRRKIAYTSINQLSQITFPMFVKPVDDKFFKAQIYDKHETITERQDLSKDDKILVSEPVHFIKEFRAHILQSQVVSINRYSLEGELSISSTDEDMTGAQNFVQDVINNSTEFTPPAVVIDIGLLKSSHWAVVEANPVFGAGLYNAKPENILPVLLEACKPIDQLDESLRGFVYPVEFET